MLQKDELKKLAQARLYDAKVLFDAKRYDGAVYLCGYAVELALKHRICRTLNWSEFPEKEAEFRSFKTHKLDVLLRLTGIEQRIRSKHIVEWSAVATWDPEARYKPIGQVKAPDAQLMLDSAVIVGEEAMKGIIEKLIRVEKKMSADKGAFHLFALFLREDAHDRWDLVVASPWIDQNQAVALKYIASKVQSVLKADEMLMLSRIVLIDDTNPALNAIQRTINVEHGCAEVKDSDFFGLKIRHAYLITVRKTEPSLPVKRKISGRR